ncbi:MAG: helix-turn-helix domain-containing protein [Silvibacterium sp.]
MDNVQRQNDDPLYSVREAAKYLGDVSPYSINAWLSQGRLARTKISARTFIRKSELERFIRDCGRRAPADQSGK